MSDTTDAKPALRKMESHLKESRSSLQQENLQEHLDADEKALSGFGQQYQTPPWYVEQCSARLPSKTPSTILDPQGAEGNLVNIGTWSTDKLIIDIDNRLKSVRAKLITGNCVKVGEAMDDAFPDLHFECINANPPFGRKWRLADGDTIDSTLWTWKFATGRGNYGFFIANASTIEKFGINKHEWVYHYETVEGLKLWKGVREGLRIGTVFWKNPTPKVPTEGWRLNEAWLKIQDIVDEEKVSRPNFNIYLDGQGYLKTYLSHRSQTKLKLTKEQILQLNRINGTHPLTLTTEKETRDLLTHLVTCGIYTFQPQAKEAVTTALREVNALACPIMPVTEFEAVAYADEEETLECITTVCDERYSFTAGQKYPITTGTYKLVFNFKRKKPHFNEETGVTSTKEHECQRTGQDRYVQVVDDAGNAKRFMGVPKKDDKAHFEFDEAELWKLFKRPTVKTIAEASPEWIERNKAVLDSAEMLAGFEYYRGQREYLARVASKSSGLVAAATGCHEKGAPILMADGTIRKVEDIRVGEVIQGWDDTPRIVLELRRGRSQMARIVPTKGDPFIVNTDHILTLVKTDDPKQVVDVSVRDWIGWGKTMKHEFKLFRMPVTTWPEMNLPLDPYFLGLLIGDGHLRRTTGRAISITKPDPEIKAAIMREVNAHGWRVRVSGSERNPTFHITNCPGLHSKIEALGLDDKRSGEKFIPDCYKRGSIDQRLGILAGLMDTDGSLTTGGYDFLSASKRLAEDVVFVARSIGLAAYMKPCRKGCQGGFVGDYYRVSISGEVCFIPCRIHRKKAPRRQQKKQVWKTGFKVELLPEDDYYGFTITGDGRYLMGDFTVTHNTGKTLMAISLLAMKAPERALIIAPQGTMRSSSDGGDDDDEQEYAASQWIQEINRFAPELQVWEIFSYGDYERICSLNKGVLPPGVYVTYPQAMFLNEGARESAPDTWDDTKLAAFLKSKFDLALPEAPEGEMSKRYWCDTVGVEQNGIRSILVPCLATKIGGLFDLVILDEAHVCFPAGTWVMTDKGKLTINEIVERKLDVRVLTCNPDTRVTQWKHITDWKKNPVNRPLVKLTHEHGSIICTDNHELFTPDGKKEAATIRPGEVLLTLPHAIQDPKTWQENASVLQRPVCDDGKQHVSPEEEGARTVSCSGLLRVQQGVPSVSAIGNPQAQVLQSSVPTDRQAETQSSSSCQISWNAEGNKGLSRIEANAVKQSDVEPFGEGKGVQRPQGKAISVSSRRQWPTNSSPGCACISTRARMGDGVVSGASQGGHWEPITENGHRGGRKFPQEHGGEVEGCEEGIVPQISRVVSVEVLERRDSERLTRRGGEGHFVYCLEVEGNHNFFANGILVSNCTNLNANITQMLLRLQPKYRWALTATPITNIVSNLFSLMGWIAVPDWYKGERRNAAWPYARNELGKFDGTFLCMERDFTEEHDRRRADPMWRGVCTKPSPVISSPARLLKLLKPSMAYLSKEQCSPKYIPPEIIDVRVPLGKEQATLYGYYLNRAHIPAKHPLIRARKQTAWLRGICADPAGFAHGGSATPKVSSNLNPKVIAILELTRDILARNEQVVIINSRVGLSDTLQHRLAEAGVSIARIDSTMAPEQHARQANLFKQRKAAVMLMGIKCAASHSFDQCVNEIIGSVEYSPGPFVQAQGRIDRVTNKVVKKIYCILHKDTIEELMFDVVATKDDAATICLKGQRIPRDYKPVDGGEILATAMERFAAACSKPERDCELEWPTLRDAIREASLDFLT